MPSRRLLALALTVASLAACARRPRPDDVPTPVTEGRVADAAGAYTCAADAAQQLGYAIPEGVAERARAGTNVGGGSFDARRRTARADGIAMVEELSVRVRRRSGGGGVLRVSPARWEEFGQSAPPAVVPGVRPTGRIGRTVPDTASVGRASRRSRTRRMLVPAETTTDAAALVSRCAG